MYKPTEGLLWHKLQIMLMMLAEILLHKTSALSPAAYEPVQPQASQSAHADPSLPLVAPTLGMRTSGLDLVAMDEGHQVL